MGEVKQDILLTVDIVIFTIRDNELKVLLIKRKYPPYKGTWAIPGGFVENKEDLEAAARRELQEETNVKDVYLEQLYSFGEPKRDPRGRVVTVAYFALIDSKSVKLKAETDVSDAQWFSAYDLPSVGFDHDVILDYAMKRLRYKLEYTTIGFELLSKKFTLNDVQNLYEVILNKKLDKRNFRKKLLSLKILNALKETQMKGVHRPAQLYTLKKKSQTFPKSVI